MIVDLIDKLVDRILQLANHGKLTRRALLDDHATPLFEAFEAIHAQYLASFNRYRNVIATSTEPLTPTHSLIGEIQSENLFTQHHRERLIQSGAAAVDEALAPLVAHIHEYLVDVRIANEPVAGYRGNRFANPQHWRRSFLHELEHIFDAHWQPILDPNSARPPLYGSELQFALKEGCLDAGIPPDAADASNRLKAWFAIRALDEVVADMQQSYASIAAEYATLRSTLLK